MNLSERINDTSAARWVIEEIKRMEAERDALVNRSDFLNQHISAMAARCLVWQRHRDPAPAAEEVLEGALDDKAATSLARLKAQWQAEVLDKLAVEGNWASEAIRWEADELRRQAEGGEV